MSAVCLHFKRANSWCFSTFEGGNASNSMASSSGTSSGTTTTPVAKSSSKKSGSTPQFRWRRRKRRSKAQYPEMSRYLLPIDDGEEVQHLGRTLECTLCGLRGKRCHLTLHFKAKHNEVIDLAGVHSNRKQTKKQNTVQTNSVQNQPELNCWQPPTIQEHLSVQETNAGANNANEDTPVQGTSQNIWLGYIKDQFSSL